MTGKTGDGQIGSYCLQMIRADFLGDVASR